MSRTSSCDLAMLPLQYRTIFVVMLDNKGRQSSTYIRVNECHCPIIDWISRGTLFVLIDCSDQDHIFWVHIFVHNCLTMKWGNTCLSMFLLFRPLLSTPFQYLNVLGKRVFLVLLVLDQVQQEQQQNVGSKIQLCMQKRALSVKRITTFDRKESTNGNGQTRVRKCCWMVQCPSYVHWHLVDANHNNACVE